VGCRLKIVSSYVKKSIGLLDYRLPTTADLPAGLRSILVENADGPVPHGSKGIGGSGLMPTVSAMARAIGVRLTELPLAPKRVWQAMRVARDALPPCEAET
jgi:CO/xanthine dehydrogenase Mo-binding subunit